MSFSGDLIMEIRSHSKECDLTRTFSSDWLKLIQQLQLFKMYLPSDVAGLMLTMPNAVRTIEQAAYIDGNFGWAIMIGSGGNFFAPFMSPATTKKIFAPTETVIAGSGTPSGTARRVPGGYIVSGSWKYCSGSSYSTIFTGNCYITENIMPMNPVILDDSQRDSITITSEQPPNKIRSFAFTSDQVQITPDWTSFGLRATEGHSFTVQNVFVPDEMTFDITEKKHMNDPIFNYPFLQFSQLTIAAVVMGIARHYFEEVEQLFTDNRSRWEATSATRYAFVMEKMTYTRGLFERNRERFHQIVEQSWGIIEEGNHLANEDLNQITRICKEVAQSTVKQAADVFPYTGIDSLMETSSLNRAWRDLQTASQHSLLIQFNER